MFSNITNLYTKVQANRKNAQSKCSRERCDMILNKVKKVKKTVDFLQNINITVLEEMLNSLKNTTTVTIISEMQTQLTALNTNATAQQAEINTLKTEVTTLSTNATAQQVEINTLKTEVTTLQANITSLNTQVSSLQTTTNTNTQDIDKIGKNILSFFYENICS